MSLKLINGLDFAGKLNSVEAVTEAGKNFLKNYKAYLFQNAASYGLVNGFIAESQNYGYDTGVMQVLSSVLSFVNENKIGWKLSSACESIENNNSQYNYLAKSMGLSRAEKLLELNESEIVSYIKSGAMKGLNFIPEFRSITKEVYNASVNETVYGSNYVVNLPFSFVLVTENEQYFNVLGKTYRIAEGKAELAKCPDAQFNAINALLPNFKQVDESLVYEWQPSYASDVYKFSLNENGIEFTKGKVNEHFDDVPSFREYADVFNRQLRMNESRSFMNIVSNVATVFEGINSIVTIDSARVMECADGTILAIVEGADNVQLNVARSLHNGQSQTEYEYMVEALDQVKAVTGNDIKAIYESRIDEDCKKADPDSYKSIQEQLAASRNAEMDLRKNKIAILAEQFKNDPVKIALLNNVAKELAILESKK